MTHVRAAEQYHPADDVGVAVAYFDPAGARSRRENLARFLAPLRRSGLALSLVEAVAPGQEAALPAGNDVHHVASEAPLWQKERLLGLAIERLPRRCTKVVWLDADVLFTDADWAERTSRALEGAEVVQPFSRAVRLREGERDGGEDDLSDESFAAVLARDPDAFRAGRYALHGHTGFAWAARREVLSRGSLFDEAVAGGADHLMAHAFAGDARESRCTDRLLGRGTPLRARFETWAERMGARRMAPIAGDLLHLWHGRLEDRRYVERNERLAASGFDPARDLVRTEGEALRWSGRQDPAMEAWLRDYFTLRRDDG